MSTVKLDRVFKDNSWQGDDDMNYLITLAPDLSDYTATLDYDQAGNANVTIRRKHKDGDITILDMSLDNGEINVAEEQFRYEQD